MNGSGTSSLHGLLGGDVAGPTRPHGSSEAPVANVDQNRAAVERLKEQLTALDQRKERLMKSRPPLKTKSGDEVESYIKARQMEMERSSLTLKEEKAALLEFKQMRQDSKRLDEWEKEMETVQTMRKKFQEHLKQAYDAIDHQRAVQWREQSSAALGLPLDKLHELRLPVDEDTQEVLSTPMWKEKLTECGVVGKMERGTRKAVLLAGTPTAVDQARALIEALGPVSVLRKPMSEEEQGLLIGRRGATIAQLQRDTGCSLDVKRSSGTLTIAGPTELVQSANLLIEELIRAQRRVEVKLVFDPEQKGTLLGKNGSTINRIQQQSEGAQLEIARGDECFIRVWGPSAAVARARKALVELLHLDAPSRQVLEVPTELLDIVIGRGGENVKKLEAEHGVSIDSSRSADRGEPSRMKIRGSVDGVKRAIAAVSAIIDREKKIEEVLMVRSEHIGLLLGKGGATVNAIQRASGATLGVAKRPDLSAGDDKAAAASTSQAVTVRGNKASVSKALAALEAVLQYQAESTEEIEVDPRMMPLLIGKGGEEINRVRAETGAAIDGERDDAKPRLKIRGSKVSVEAATKLIHDLIAANSVVAESVILPWHAIDKILGPNASTLQRLEAEHAVQIELPGHNLAAEIVMMSSFLSISSAMTLRGRKKCVDAAALAISTIAAANVVEEMQLSDADASLLSGLCLDTPSYLSDLAASLSVEISFDPRLGVATFRGEASLDAQVALRQGLSRARKAEESIDCPPLQYSLLDASEGMALVQLQQLCAPALVALQEVPPAVCLLASSSDLPEATEIARGWLVQHEAAERRTDVPPEVVSVLKARIQQLQLEYRVCIALEEPSSADVTSGTLRISGAAKLADAATAAASRIIRQYAHVSESLAVGDAELQLIRLLIDRAFAPRSERLDSSSGAPGETRSSLPAKLFDGVQPQTTAGASGVGGAMVVLKGTAEPVSTCKASLGAILDEARRSAVKIPVTTSQLSKLAGAPTRPLSSQRRSESLQKRLQESHLVALVADQKAMALTIIGAADAVRKVQTILDDELDVDEHSREVNDRLVPIIIGRGGANIKKLQTESGASVDLDRTNGRVTVRGRRAQVLAAVTMLDELSAQFNESEIRVNPRQIPLLIGRGGSTIRQLQADTNATIDIRKEEGVVRIRGSPAAIEEGLRRIRELLAPQNSNVAQTTGNGHNPAAGPPPGLPTPMGRAPPGLHK